jgi:hypothetical protein
MTSMTAAPTAKTCTIDNCTDPEQARGYCPTHYSRWRRYGDANAPVRERAPSWGDTPCAVDDCGEKVHAKGYCPKHLRRFRLYGDPLGSGERAPAKTVDDLRFEAYHGLPGGTTDDRGYRYRTGARGVRHAEHRLVMEYHLGRALFPDETVHHRYGDRSDNRIERLELWSSMQPAGQRVADKLAFAMEIIERYANLPADQREVRH